GEGRFPARVTEAIAPGTVFLPMHWGALWTDNGEANSLTHPESCPISLEPELKACAVSLAPAKLDNEVEVERESDRSPARTSSLTEKSLSIKT
ncbi:MAG: molybdopterin dinucleotide binding domain-containing protein, partial [Cyanobacteria bacterium J06635_13]